jgi:hypothetical protein
VLFNVGLFHFRWRRRALWQRYFNFSLQGGNMGLLVAGLVVVILVVLAAFAAGYVMVAREQMAIDERLHRFTQ